MAEGDYSMTAQNRPAEREGAWQITVHLEPQGKTVCMPRPKTVWQLMNRLNLKPCSALIIRDGGLLTKDREILPGDEITVRSVVSSG